MRLPPLILTAHEIHGAAPPPSSFEANTCAGAEVLAETLGAVQRMGYRFVEFGEFMTRRQGGAVALLTFDDGYSSLRDHAFPMLAALGIPAVVFLVSSSLRSPRDPFPHWLHVVRDNRDTIDRPTYAPFVSHAHVRHVLAASGFSSLRELLAQLSPLALPMPLRASASTRRE